MANSNNVDRISWIDASKGLAAFLVVAGHTIDFTSPLRRYIFSIHMPLFFILAGYTFKKKNWIPLLKSSATRLFLPYTLLFCIWNITNYLGSSGSITANGLIELALTFIFASGTDVPNTPIKAVGMSWFLACLFVSRLIFNAVLAISEKSRHPLAVSFLISAVSMTSGIIIGKHLRLFLPFSLDLALVSIFFLWSGYAMRSFIARAQTRKLPYGAAAFVVWTICSSFSYLEMAARTYNAAPLAIIAALSGTYMICSFFSAIEDSSTPSSPTQRVYKRFVSCGKNSMGIYCFHAIDWLIPWSTIGTNFSTLPFPKGWLSIARFFYNLCLTKLSSLLH